MILRIAIVIAVLIIAILIAGILVFAATKPNVLPIQRSILINASPDNIFIFALINNFHSWSGWVPQDKEDSTMTRTYRGAAYGKGAVSDRNSTGSAGKVRMTITESVPSEMISIQVDFAKPFDAHNLNQFPFEPAGTSTKVTWTMI